MENLSLECGVCNLRQLSKPSDVWCPDCDEGLCSDCMEHHSLSKSSRDHKAISIGEYLNLKSEGWKISQFCEKHKEKYQIFCKKHDACCCRRCVTESHNECREIAVLDDMVKNIKTSTVLGEAEIKLSDVVDNIQRIIDRKKQNVNKLHKQRTDIETKVRQTRRRINEHLDKLEKGLLKDLYTTEATENKQISSLISTLEKYQTELRDLHGTLSNIKKNSSDLQTFLAMKQAETSVAAKEKFIMSIVENDRVEYKYLSLKTDATLQSFEETVHNFGEIKYEIIQWKVGMVKTKNRQAQIMLSEVPSRQSVDRLNLTKLRAIKIDNDAVTSCLMFHDGRTMFSCNWEQRILAYNTDAKLDFEILLPKSSAFDVTPLTDDTIAVSSGGSYDKNVTIVNIQSKKVRDIIPVHIQNYGVTSRRGEIFFCALGQGIKVLNLIRKRTKDIVSVPLPENAYVTSTKDKFFYTDWKTQTVVCCNMTGKKEWEFRDERVLQSPAGICTDNDGNVYVVGTESQNVVAISPDGQRCRELLDDKSDLTNPWAICYEKSRNEILLANHSSTALVYSVEHN